MTINHQLKMLPFSFPSHKANHKLREGPASRASIPGIWEGPRSPPTVPSRKATNQEADGAPSVWHGQGSGGQGERWKTAPLPPSGHSSKEKMSAAVICVLASHGAAPDCYRAPWRHWRVWTYITRVVWYHYFKWCTIYRRPIWYRRILAIF